MDGSLKTLGLFLTLQFICCLASGIMHHFLVSHSHERWCCGGKKRHSCIGAISSLRHGTNPVLRRGGTRVAPQLPDPTAEPPRRPLRSYGSITSRGRREFLQTKRAKEVLLQQSLNYATEQVAFSFELWDAVTSQTKYRESEAPIFPK